MGNTKPETNDGRNDNEKLFEIHVEEITSDTVTVRADSREDAFNALKEPQDREVQEALVRMDFDNLSERRPVDGRRATELEDSDDPDIDVDLTDE